MERAVRPSDCKAENEFQKWAWSSRVLGFLNAARRELNWSDHKADRTLLGIMLGYVHAKRGGGLSNQLRQSKAMAPEYAVRWWKARRLSPPDLDPVEFLSARVKWRYAKGLPPGAGQPVIYREDAGRILNRRVDLPKADLVFTSPPYRGVTNYQYDNWIRLWVAGRGPALPISTTEQRYEDTKRYEKMLSAVFDAANARAKRSAIFYVRTYADPTTLLPTVNVLVALLKGRRGYLRQAGFPLPTQTALFGDQATKPGDVDLLFAPDGVSIPRGFCGMESRTALTIMATSGH
ncbi:MAG TPA: hypothetical protein VMU06_23055 [Stellaceae bacterium]|nr:hypothetical protein [Stellaceae bacterium]